MEMEEFASVPTESKSLNHRQNLVADASLARVMHTTPIPDAKSGENPFAGTIQKCVKYSVW